MFPTQYTSTKSLYFCICNTYFSTFGTVYILSSVQLSHSIVSNSLWAMNCSMPGPPSITNSRSLPKLMSIESVMPSNYLIFCCPLLLPPTIYLSIKVFPNESILPIKWPEYWSGYWSLSFSVSPSKEYSGLISFRIDWFGLLAVQGTLKSLLHHHSFRPSHKKFLHLVSFIYLQSRL